MNYLNLSPGSAPLVVKVSEGDIGREISFTLVEDGLEYTIPTGSTITCEILKSDGHGTSIPCAWSGSVVTFETTEQSTIRAGKATAELRIVNGADDIGTANFILAVEPRPINADTDQTDSSYSQTGDAGDVWTLGSNGTPSWAPSGLDASSATAGQAPIADGEGGWAWGDVATDGDSVPTNVRQAILALFQNGVYTRDDMSDEVAVIASWATEITAISVSPTTLNINGMETQTLIATTQPAGGIVSWSSSDETIATVAGGVVTPMGVNGSCVITATCGGKSASCNVTVSGFATLESISAVYSGGTVYTTDTLESLKSSLTVTAHWSDSRTTTVTGYTLSGTIAEGTQTITVAYSGKTTTFSVTCVVDGWLYHFEQSLASSGTKDFGFTGTENYATGYDGTGKCYHHIVGTEGTASTDTYGIHATGLSNVPNLSGDFTVAFWFKSSTINRGHPFVAWKYTGTSGKTNAFSDASNIASGWSVSKTGDPNKATSGMQLAFSSSMLQIRLMSTDLSLGAIYSVTFPEEVDTREWHHYALTRKGTTVRFFVDGEVIFTVSIDSSLYFADQVCIGNNFNTNATNPTGLAASSYADFVDELFVAEYCKWVSKFNPTSIAY